MRAVGHGEQHDQRGAEPDRGQEAQAGQHQGGHRHDDGAAGEQDGGAGRAHGVGQRGRVVLAGGAVLAVAGHDEQGVVDADPQPDHRRDGRGGAGDVHGVGQQGDAAQAGGDRHQGERDRDQRGHDRPEGDDEHDQRGQQAGRLRARGLRLGVDERRVAAELGRDAGLPAGSIAAAIAASGSGPSSVDGRSKVISAKPMRPSGDTVPAVNGSATVATCSTPAIRATAASTVGRWRSSRSPSGAANTAMALPPAASGKRSSSSSIASSLWLPGATRSSANAAAGGARQPQDDGGGDRPGPDRDPWSAGAGVADAADEAMHDGRSSGGPVRTAGAPAAAP